MKKFLSLVLALVMTMSLVTISAGAKDFTDSDKVTYDDAIEVMSELKVIDGYTDGSFRPTVELNRGAAAKIICNMILGPTTASALSASSAPFVDVPADSVFAGYITYCAKEGIINGYADGTFRPTAPLTGYAFMKMLLGALGYDAEIEGYTGANWSVNVAKQALGIDLDDGNDNFVGTKYVTREEACLYAKNTLKATMVEYDSKTTVTVNGAQVVVGGSEAKEVSQSGYDDNMKKPFLQFAEKYFEDLKVTRTTDDFGRPADKWKIKNKEVGTYADKADASYTAKVKGKTIKADTDIDPKDYTWKAYRDGEPVTLKDLNKKLGEGQNAYYEFVKRTGDPADEKIGGNGTLTEVFYDEDEEEATITLVRTFLMQVDGDYDEDDEELTLTEVDANDAGYAPDAPELEDGEDVLSADDFDNLDTFEDEDYVLVTVANGEIKSIAKAEKVTGTVTEYVKDDTVTLGGTEYEYSATFSESEKMTYSIDDDYEAYLDAYGYIIYVDGDDGNDDYVYIAEFDTSSNLSVNSKIVAYAYFLDGTEDEITIDEIDGEDVKGKDFKDEKVNGHAAGQWFKFTEKNGKYDLDIEKDQKGCDFNKNEETKVVDGDNTVMIEGVDLRGTKDTVFVVVDDDDNVKVYTGIKNAPELTAKGDDAKVQAIYDGKYAEYVFIDLGDEGTSKGGSNSSDIIFVMELDKEGTDSGDNKYYRYKAILNGEETKVKFELTGKFAPAKTEQILFTDVEYDSETGFVTAAEAVTDPIGSDDYDSVLGIKDASVSQKAGVVTVDDGKDTYKYYLADDYTIFVIEDKDDVSTVTAKKLASDYEKGGLNANIYGVLNSDDEYTALYISVK